MMSIKVRASVIDIRRDSPRPTDHFLVDSNVWYWVAYRHARRVTTRNQDVHFLRYLDMALMVDAALYRCPLSYSELAHSIERSEWEWLLQAGQAAPSTMKEARRDPLLRQRALTELAVAWSVVISATINHSAPLMLDDATADMMATNMHTYAIDGYDLLMLHAMQQAHLTQLITDDADFGQVADLHVFTANPYLIQQAAQQGRLITRPLT